MKKITSISLAIVLMAGLFLGCKKSDDQVAPILPPAGSMTIDFSNFTGTQKSANIESQFNSVAAGDKSNLNTAVMIAGVWNTLLGINLVVPVSSFKLAVNSTPSFLGENKWEWKYNFDVVGATYKARLTGLVGLSDVKWEMNISREGINAFPEVKWFEGSSNLDGKSGHWTLNHSKEFLEPMLQIDWDVVGTGIGKIKYTYTRETKDDRSKDFFNGSSIEYGLTTTNPLNAYYNVHQNTSKTNLSFNDLNIEWNTTTFNGHIKSNNVFFDDLWHCWNATGDNVDCN